MDIFKKPMEHEVHFLYAAGVPSHPHCFPVPTIEGKTQQRSTKLEMDTVSD